MNPQNLNKILPQKNKQKMMEFIASRPILQEMLKDPRREGKQYRCMYLCIFTHIQSI